MFISKSKYNMLLDRLRIVEDICDKYMYEKKETLSNELCSLCEELGFRWVIKKYGNIYHFVLSKWKDIYYKSNEWDDDLCIIQECVLYLKWIKKLLSQ